MILKNKRGAEKILAVYWFAILVLISAGVFSIVFSFQSPYDVRGLETSILAGKVADCISEQGVLERDIVEKLGSNKFTDSVKTEKSSEEVKTTVLPGTGQIITVDAISDIESTFDGFQKTCDGEINGDACRKVIGNKILQIVSGMKLKLKETYPDIDLDETVLKDGVSENFECLVLQVAQQEGGLIHCQTIEDENPLHCDGKKELTRLSGDEWGPGDPKSWGALQIVGKKHEVDPSDFEASVKYAAEKILIEEYIRWKDGRIFPSTTTKQGKVVPITCDRAPQKTYSGWETALRSYNGWNACSVGSVNYVEEVASERSREEVARLFPSQCPSKKLELDLMNKCNFNFKNGEKEEQYYFELEFANFNTGETINVAWEGNRKWKTSCTVIQAEDEQKTQPKCVKRSFYSVDENNVKYLIKILSVVRNTESNVK